MKFRKRKETEKNSLLVFNTAYTLEQIRHLNLEIFVQARDLGGFFQHVYTVNPTADLQYEEAARIKNSGPKIFTLDEKNSIIEGRTYPLSSSSRFIRFLWFFFNQVRLIVFVFRNVPSQSVSVIRGENALYAGIYSLLFSRILRVPYLIGSWGNPNRLRLMSKKPMMPNLFPSIGLEMLIERQVLKYAKFALTQNEENRGYLFEMGVPEERSFIIPLEIGIHESHFVPRKSRKSSPELVQLKRSGVNILVCIARLESDKFVDHAIRSCVILKKGGISFRLYIIGDGRMRRSLEELAEDLELVQDVKFLGNLSQSRIAELLTSVDVNIAPLCGRSLLEASLAGCPSVAYDVDWHPDVVINGKTGILVQNLDYNKLGQGIVELLLNPNLKSEYGQNVRRLVMSRSNQKDIARRLNEIYWKSTKDNPRF